MKSRSIVRWGARWYSKNRLDGVREYPMFNDSCMPLLFLTKREAMNFIKEKYSYVAKRKDLRQEPHGWRMPKPIRLKVTLEEMK